MRATSWRTWPTRAGLSSWPVASWKRRLNSSLRASPSRVASSSPSSWARSVALAIRPLLPHVRADHEARLEGQLLNGPLHGRARQLLVDAGQLEQDAARVHHGNPQLGVPLPRAHTGLGRLVGHGLVGEDTDPDLPTTLDVTGHGDTGRLDLARRQPPGLHRLNAEVAER